MWCVLPGQIRSAAVSKHTSHARQAQHLLQLPRRIADGANADKHIQHEKYFGPALLEMAPTWTSIHSILACAVTHPNVVLRTRWEFKFVFNALNQDSSHVVLSPGQIQRAHIHTTR